MDSMELFFPSDLDLLSVGYAVTLAAYLVRDILPLRALLAGAALVMIGFGWQSGLDAMVAWNSVFMLVNLVHLGLLIRERRPVRFPDAEARRMWESVFWMLTPREFLKLWARGERLELDVGTLCREGTQPAWMWLLLEGELSIEREGEVVAHLSPGMLVGEMSYINASTASADVVVRRPVALLRWPRAELDRWMRRHPELGRKFNGVIGQDLVRKLSSDRADPGESSAAAHAEEGPSESSPSPG
ncbi:Crp/Fnr family transcriptional regulator [Thiohalospira sp.]|uniref:Crp/Fnr family transcriptional regulator n=1 Tax=Thiohalospira sp. TaxID=3080549 RepID=UPI0039805FFE